MIQVLLIGYGKMNKLIHELASEYDVNIRRTLKSDDHLSESVFEGIDVAIDFAAAEGILDRIQLACKMQVPLVVGTTGWNEHFDAAKTIVERLQGTLIHSANFSIGVHLYMRLMKEAARTLKRYDVAIHEEHHNQKKDAPSGTAKELARIVLDSIPEKKETLTIASTRCGFQPGKHAVIFDGPDDTIELVHTARNRNGFARGALEAARWIQNKKGIFTIEDLL